MPLVHPLNLQPWDLLWPTRYGKVMVFRSFRVPTCSCAPQCMHGLAWRLHSGNSAEFSQHLRLAGDANPSQSPAGSQLTTGPWVSHADELRAAEAANPKAHEHE